MFSYYDYDENGNMSRFTSPLDDQMDIEYTGRNQLKSVFMNGQLVHQAEYDEKGRQIWTEDAFGNRDGMRIPQENGIRIRTVHIISMVLRRLTELHTVLMRMDICRPDGLRKA